MEQYRLLLLVLLTGIIFSAAVLLISKFQKKSRFPKYIPAIILFAAGAVSIAKARWFSEGMEGLGYIVLAMLAVGGGVLTLITAIIIDILKKNSRNGS